MRSLVIYTDGGCHGNPGPGAWAWRIVDISNAVVAEAAGFDPSTTNNRMELNAVIRGLHAVRGHNAEEVRIVTDSQYVRQGITSWIQNWKRNGWMTKARTAVKNADLWRELDAVNAQVSPEWSWVKGHSGDQHNEACDQLVQAAIKDGVSAT